MNEEEELEAKKALGGQSQAGITLQKPKISDENYAEKALTGEVSNA